jgi:RNase P/RNase MRP subunit POP5
MIKEIFGDLGLAEAEIRLVKLEVHKNVAILRCNKDQVDKVRFAMLFLKKIGVNSVIISIIKVSGTIKGLKGKTSIW